MGDYLITDNEDGGLLGKEGSKRARRQREYRGETYQRKTIQGERKKEIQKDKLTEGVLLVSLTSGWGN